MDDVREYADEELPGVPILLTEDQTPEDMAAMIVEALGEPVAQEIAVAIVATIRNKRMRGRR